MKIGVIGTGAWGAALTAVLSENLNEKIFIYDKNPSKLNYFLNNKTFEVFNWYKFSSNLVVEFNLKTIVENADILLIAVPTKFLYDLIYEIKGYINSDKLIINVAKGFEPKTEKPILEFIKDIFFDLPYEIKLSSILGPGFAKEVINHNLTCVCSVSNELKIAKKVQKLFSNSYFRVYTLTDVIGAEIGTALKNIVAIGSGIVKGLGYGENTKAALITRGLAEIKRFGKFFGAKDSTFLGLTGLGDLVLTCNTDESRNFSAGYEIGIKNDGKAIVLDENRTIEGVVATKTVYDIAIKNNIVMPITFAIYDVLYKGEKPSNLVSVLMERPLKNECL